jgi:hypothetical protein
MNRSILSKCKEKIILYIHDACPPANYIGGGIDSHLASLLLEEPMNSAISFKLMVMVSLVTQGSSP